MMKVTVEYTLEGFELTGPTLPPTVSRAVLVELAMLTTPSGSAPNFVAVGKWLGAQRVPIGFAVSNSGTDGKSTMRAWRKYRDAKGDESALAVVLGAEHQLLSPVGAHKVCVILDHETDGAFDPEQSKRSISKMAVLLARQRSVAAAESAVLARTRNQLQSLEHEKAALAHRVESLGTCIAKLKLQLLGSPKVREALAAVEVALSRADLGEKRAGELELLLSSAAREAKKAEAEHYAQCKVG